MLHNVLVCLDGSQGWSAQQNCQSVAFEFAAQYGARLIGLHVRPLPPPLVPVMFPPEMALGGSMAMAAMEANMRLAVELERHEDEGELFSQRFLEAARSCGVEATCHSVRGDLIEKLVEHAHAADLVLLPDAHEAGVPPWPLGRLVRAVARPVLLASQAVVPIRRIAVAYDGSIGADRALQTSVDIAVNWGRPNATPSSQSWPAPRPEVILLAVSRNGASHNELLGAAEEYVRSYDLDSTSRVLKDQGSVSEAICTAADEETASLLSMGAYNHSSLREALLGSTTDEVVEHRHQPLLLCH